MFDALIKGLSLPHHDTLEIMFSPYSLVMKKKVILVFKSTITLGVNFSVRLMLKINIFNN
jgi:hypothetical protein